MVNKPPLMALRLLSMALAEEAEMAELALDFKAIGKPIRFSRRETINIKTRLTVRLEE